MTYSSQEEPKALFEEYKETADEEVLRSAKKNPELFGVLVDRYEAAFLRKAVSILHNPEDAEEIVQDTFTRIYLYADKYEAKEGAKFSSWAYTILTRLCFTRYQKRKTERGRILDLEPETFERLPDTENFLSELSVKNEVLDVFSRIPESCARILRLQFIEGKTQEEIAELDGSTVAAVKTRVHRAKKIFKKFSHHEPN